MEVSKQDSERKSIIDNKVNANKQRLVKEGSSYWDPDSGYIYDKDGYLIAHDAVYRPANRVRINLDNAAISGIDRSDSRYKKKTFTYYLIYKQLVGQVDNSITSKVGSFVFATENLNLAKSFCAKHSEYFYSSEEGDL